MSWNVRVAANKGSSWLPILATGSCHEDSRSAAFIGLLTSIVAVHTFLLEFISELFTVSVPVIFISSVLGILFFSINAPDCFRLRFKVKECVDTAL